MRRFLLFLCLLGFVVGGCVWTAPPRPIIPMATPVLTPVVADLPISAQNAGAIVELRTLEGSTSVPVAALAFSADAQEVVAVHAPTGILNRWRITDQTLVKQLDVGPVGVTAASFSQDGGLLVTAAGDITPTAEAGLAVDMKGYRLFDTRSGALLMKDLVSDTPYGLQLADVVLSGDGQRIGDTSDSGFGVSDSATGKSQRTVVVFGDEAVYGTPLVQRTATFDPTAEWSAYMANDGTVRLWDLQDPDSEIRIIMDISGAPLALAIDPARRYIGTVTTEMLAVRQLKNLAIDDILSRSWIQAPVPSGPAAAIAFSPDGTLMAVSTATNWQLWSIPARQRLFEQDTGAYAVAFSPDGRLLALGGTDGTIHLWGVPD